jgi:hypothetical protein
VFAEWVAILTFLAAGQVDVRSSTDCPSAPAIAARLGPLLPGMSGRDVADVQLLGVQPDGTTDLYVSLSDPGLVPIGGRRVPLRGSCAQLAEAVAAILAAWKSDPGTRAAPGTTDDTIAARHDGASEARAPSPFTMLAGAGVGAHVVGGECLGGNLELRLGRAASHWQLRLGFAAQTARQMGLVAGAYSGQVDWQHTSAAVGLAWQSFRPRWQLGLDAGLVGGWATLAGSGFATSRTERAFEYGAAAGLRGGRAWGRLSFWLETRPTLWLKGHEVRVQGSTASRDLPRVDVAASLGVSVQILP